MLHVASGSCWASCKTCANQQEPSKLKLGRSVRLTTPHLPSTGIKTARRFQSSWMLWRLVWDFLSQKWKITASTPFTAIGLVRWCQVRIECPLP
jgi:hypothetical protein